MVVNLETISVGVSWTTPEMKTDDVKMKDLDPSISPVPLERTTEITRQLHVPQMAQSLDSSTSSFAGGSATDIFTFSKARVPCAIRR